MTHVFISYKREDRAFVSDLEQKIKEADMDTWTDAEIKAGERWRDKIDDAIHSAFAIVVVVTPAAIVSQYVTYEWAFAMGIGKPIVPIMLETAELHPKLSDLHYLDFSKRAEEPWEDLLDALRSLDPKAGDDYRDMPLEIRNAIDALASPDENARRSAVNSLVKMYPHPQAISALIHKALPHLAYDVRDYTLRNIHELEIKEAIPEIISRLSDDYSTIRSVAARILGDFGAEIAVPALIQSLKDEDVREAAADALGKIGSKDAIPHLIPLLKNKTHYGGIIPSIENALNEIGLEEDAIPQLLSLLNIKSENLNIYIAKALGKIGSEDTVPHLILLLGTEEPYQVHKGAIEALGEIGSEDAVPHLISLFEDKASNHFPSINYYILDALRKINSDEALAAVEEWEKRHKQD